MRMVKMKKGKVIINLIVIISIWLGIFASGLWYGTKVYGEYVEELQEEQELLKEEVQAFTKVSDPKTIRLYVKELNKILDDVTFLSKIVESGQTSAESLDAYFNDYDNKLNHVIDGIEMVHSELTKIDSKFKNQIIGLSIDTDENIDMLDELEDNIKDVDKSILNKLRIIEVELDTIRALIKDVDNSKINKLW